LPILCQNKLLHGRELCLTDCPAAPRSMVFDYARIEAPGQEPPAAREVVDVALLDMNHGWPNLGHDSLVHVVQDAVCDVREELRQAGLVVRVLSYDVRRSGGVPTAGRERFSLYLGTGGPGHIDPYRNDGDSPGSQGIREDASWEAPLFRLFDEVLADKDAALLAVCHSFGVMCRWSGLAEPVLRTDAKGGKSTGVLQNILTDEAQEHPWFGALARALPDHRRLPIVDNRLYDLLPKGPLPDSVVPIGYETLGVGGPAGDAVTMLEWARDRDGVMPRVFGVNHHPEIVDRSRQLLILEQKRERGDVSQEWYDERVKIMTETYPDAMGARRLHQTSDYTLLGPLRFHLYRQVRLRARQLGRTIAIDEGRLVPAGEDALMASAPGAGSGSIA
jgi:hypothetical protein